MKLTFQEKGIDHAPNIVDDRVSGDPGDTGVRVNFDLANMTAVGVGSTGRCYDRTSAEARLHVARNNSCVERHVWARAARSIARSVPSYGEATVSEINIGNSRFKNMACDEFGLFDDLF